MKVRQRRKLLLEMLCVGSGPDIEVADAMGWDYEILAVADCKPVAQKWLKTHWSKQLGHLYDDNHALCQDAGGYCHKHKRCCSCPEPPPDIGASGSPCPPFSAQRQKNGVTNKTSDPTDHPAYSEAMTNFGLWIGQRRPHSWFLEEVGGFDRRLKSLGDRSPLQVFCKDAQTLGYAVAVFKINHLLFVKVSRPRIWVVGVSKQTCGGELAISWIDAAITEALEYRSKLPVPSIHDVVDLDGRTENNWRRIARDRVLFCFCIVSCALTSR